MHFSLIIDVDLLKRFVLILPSRTAFDLLYCLREVNILMILEISLAHDFQSAAFRLFLIEWSFKALQPLKLGNVGIQFLKAFLFEA